MNTTCQDGSKSDPEKYGGAPLSSGKSSVNWSKSCNVQELDQEQLPPGHRNEINAVIDPDCRSFSVIRPKYPVNNSTIDEITCNQYC